jgi:hypothetical protein
MLARLMFLRRILRPDDDEAAIAADDDEAAIAATIAAHSLTKLGTVQGLSNPFADRGRYTGL